MLRAQKLGDFFEQQQAADVGEPGAAIGKMLAEITEIGGAEQGIADGMAQHISIRVAGEAGFMLDFNAAENQLAAGGERVDIVSETDAQLKSLRQKEFSDLQIARRGDFQVGFFALHPTDATAKFFHQRRLIRAVKIDFGGFGKRLQ